MEKTKRPEQRLPEEETVEIRTQLFNQYVLPNRNLIYSLCIRYSYSSQEVKDNYNEVLINFFKYIETYDPKRSIQTWLHIVTKRFVADLNVKRKNFLTTDDLDVSEMQDELCEEEEVNANHMNIDNYDKLYNDSILFALKRIKPIYREALLLQQAGYKLNEIVEISYKNGNLKTKNVETVKSRLFLAKQQLRALLDRNGNRRIR